MADNKNSINLKYKTNSVLGNTIIPENDDNDSLLKFKELYNYNLLKFKLLRIISIFILIAFMALFILILPFTNNIALELVKNRIISMLLVIISIIEIILLLILMNPKFACYQKKKLDGFDYSEGIYVLLHGIFLFPLLILIPQDYRYISYNPLIILLYSVLFSVPFIIIIKIVLKKYNLKMITLLLYLLIILYNFSTIVALNIAFDFSKPETYTAIIDETISKDVGRGGTNYYFKLYPFGPYKNSTKISVDHDDYDEFYTDKADPYEDKPEYKYKLTATNHTGFLGISYFTIDLPNGNQKKLREQNTKEDHPVTTMSEEEKKQDEENIKKIQEETQKEMDKIDKELQDDSN